MTGPARKRESKNRATSAAALALVAALLGVLLAPSVAEAVLPDEILADAGLEHRARALSKRLRCLVCQNQSIDDSDAELARDLRVLVRKRLTAGDSDEQIMAFLVARYGDFVLLKPPVKPTTWLLWFGPLAVLTLAGLGIAIAVGRRKKMSVVAPAPLSQAERAALARILGPNGAGDGGDGEADSSGEQPGEGLR